MKPVAVWISLTLLLCAGALARADTLDDALHRWHAGDRAKAVVDFHRLAEQGDGEASLFLGYLYRQGIGVPSDDAKAAIWYRRAAERGEPEAQYELALMYELGLGVTQDIGEASFWYARASAQACPDTLSAGGRLGDR